MATLSNPSIILSINSKAMVTSNLNRDMEDTLNDPIFLLNVIRYSLLSSQALEIYKFPAIHSMCVNLDPIYILYIFHSLYVWSIICRSILPIMNK